MARTALTMAWRGLPEMGTLSIAVLSIAAFAIEPATAQINPNTQTVPQGATDTDDDPVRSNARVPGVAGFTGRGLSISTSLNSRYESNLSRRLTPDDGFRIQPRISADYGLGSNRLGVFVAGSYGRDIVLGNRFFGGGNRSNVSAGVDFELSRCSGEIGAGLRESLNLRNDAAQFGAFQQRSLVYGFAASCQLGRALSINAGISRSDAQNGRGASTALNVETLAFTGGLGLNIGSLGQLSVSGSVSNVDLPGRLAVTPTAIVADGFQQRTVRVGLSRAFGSRLLIAAGASVIDNQPGTESSLIVVDGVPQFVDRSRFTGFGYDGAVDFTLSSRLSVNLTANRSINTNPFVGAFLVVGNGYAVSANTQVGRYQVAAGARFRNSSFRGSFASEFDPTPRRSDKLQIYFVRIGGRIGQRIRASLEMNHTRRISDPTALSFTSTGAGLNLSMAFGKGSR